MVMDQKFLSPFAIGVVLVALRFASPASAQTPGAPRPPVTISVGGGTLKPDTYPEQATRDLLVSLQIPISRSIAVDGSIIRSTSDHATSGYFDNRLDRPYVPFTSVTMDHEALNIGGNVLFRKAATRLSLFFGGGLSVHQATTNRRYDTRCEPRVAGGCDGRPDTTTHHRVMETAPAWQVVGGVDIRIGPRLIAFGGGRWLTTSREAGDTGLGAIGGIRLALQPVSPFFAVRDGGRPLLSSSTGGAQTTGARQMPSVMVSAGAGVANDHDSSALMRSLAIELLTGRNVVLEGEIAQWESSWERRDAGFTLTGPRGEPIVSGPHLYSGGSHGWSAGANLLFRWNPPWVSAFVGGGAFFGQQRWNSDFQAERCLAAPEVARFCPRDTRFEQENIGLRVQSVTGVDVRVAGPLRAYASVQITSMEQANVRFTSGVRVVVRTRPLAPDGIRREPRANVPPLSSERQTEVAGDKVRVTLANGLRPSGRFVSADAVTVSVDVGGSTVRYPLDQVLVVETVHHTARNGAIAGALAGFAFGYLSSCGSEDGGCWWGYGAMFAGIGAGAGGLAGAIHDRVTRSSHVIYAASSSVSIVPIAARRGGGVGMTVSF
jgi:hypothetical protein